MRTFTLITIFFLFITISLLTVSGCKEDEIGPTTFQGKVVYADNGEPFTQGVLNLASNRNVIAPGSCCVIEERDLLLSDNGEFSAEFEANGSIAYFDLFIKTTSDTTINDVVVPIITGSITYISGLDCSPYRCDNFKPSKVYRDLVIKVPR